VLPTQREITGLANRLEAAYKLRGGGWRVGCSTPRVWQEAAYTLWRAHKDNPRLIPLDPELYVAIQPVTAGRRDPWSDLTGFRAAWRYCNEVRTIIRQLRRELRTEVKHAERMIAEGATAGQLAQEERLSPLGCYIAAIRLQKPELAAPFARRSLAQHESCPLYQPAATCLIPRELYPVELALHRSVERTPRVKQASLSLN